jgi:hypothetical protein
MNEFIYSVVVCICIHNVKSKNMASKAISMFNLLSNSEEVNQQ